ncbi:hypothetical protein D0T56_03930 [Dysgonomonas sp. 520]|nr:hypothetical protein [Dysgonomonas sp. 520]
MGFSSYLSAQVGIKTENPQALLHIDAQSKTNPATGAPSKMQQSDDIVVTSDGKVGIGTIAPASKMEINTEVTSDIPIQIKDGTQGTGKFLVSDANGVGTWQNVSPPSGRVYPIQWITPGSTFATGVSTLAPGSEFTIPSDGFYSMEVRWWAKHLPSPTYVQRTTTIFELRKNNVVMDEFLYSVPIFNGSVTVYVPLYTKAKAGDVLSLWVYPLESPSTMTNVASLGWTSSKVLIKKMQID